MGTLNLALNATVNAKEQPPKLYVHGSVMVYTNETTVEIERAEPQGTNHTILLLNLTVTFKEGPMKGTQRPFFYEEELGDMNQYKQVQVISNVDDSETVDIEILG